jgi:hypothetical protein
MGTFHEPKILQALQSTPINSFMIDVPGGVEWFSKNSLAFSNHYERMLWLLPDEVCGTLLSEWIEVINAKQRWYESHSHWWPTFLATYRMSSRSYKPGKSKPRVAKSSEALTLTRKDSASAGVDLQYSLQRSNDQ